MSTAQKRPYLTFLAVIVLVLMPLMAASAAARPVTALAAGPVDTGAAPTPQAPVEIPSMRTAHSSTYRMPDGHLQARISAGDTNFRAADGSFQPISNQLVPATAAAAAGSSYQNAGNRYILSLPSDISSAPARIALGSQWIEFSLDGLSTTGSVSGSTATYAFSGGNLALTAENDVVKESLTLTSASSPSSITYALNTSTGLTATQNTAGGIDFVDSAGSVAFSFQPPTMTDATGATSSAVSFALGTDGRTLTLRADPTWLADPARQYPVVIDPTTTLSATSACWIASGSPASPSCSGSFHVGVWPSTGNINRSLLQFDLSSIPSTSQVLSADLQLTEQSSSVPDVFIPMSVSGMTRSWNTGACWDTNGTVNWTTPGGDYAATPVVTGGGGGAVGWVSHWYPTSLVQSWVNGSTANDGFMVKATSESTTTYDIVFTSPTLVVDYAPREGKQPYDTFDGPVNVYSGNLSLTSQDVSIAGVGLPVSISRTYNSLDDHIAKPVGNRWFMNVGKNINLSSLADGSEKLNVPGGTNVVFPTNGSGGWNQPLGMNMSLTKNGDGTFTVQDLDSGDTITLPDDSGGGMTSEADSSGNTVSYSYSSGKLSSITDTLGQTTSITMCPSPNTSHICTITDPAGRTYQYGYDPSGNGNLTSYTDPAGNETQYGYDPTSGNLTSITDPNGNVTTIGYDTSGRVSTITAPTNPSSGDPMTTTYTYNAGNTVVTDPRGKNTTYFFTSQGLVTSIKNARGFTSTVSWNGDNQVTEIDPPSGTSNKTTYTYDSLNRLTEVDYPDGTSQKAAYGSSATDWTKYLPTSTTDQQGQTTTYAYNDPSGTLASVTDPGGGSITCNGQTVSECATYNSNGTLATATDANGNQTSYSYYSCSLTGSPACTTGQRPGFLSQVTPPSPLNPTTYAYDTSNRLSSVTDGDSHTSTISYDKDDEVLCEDYSGSGCVGTGEYYASTYDHNGNQLSVTQGAAGPSATTTFRYDALDELIAQKLPGSGSTVTCVDGLPATTCYRYNDLGEVNSKLDAGATTTCAGTGVSASTCYTYDTTGDLTSVTDRQGVATNFSYDADVRPVLLKRASWPVEEGAEETPRG